MSGSSPLRYARSSVTLDSRAAEARFAASLLRTMRPTSAVPGPCRLDSRLYTCGMQQMGWLPAHTACRNKSPHSSFLLHQPRNSRPSGPHRLRSPPSQLSITLKQIEASFSARHLPWTPYAHRGCTSNSGEDKDCGDIRCLLSC